MPAPVVKPDDSCPCFSGNPYGECCKPFHDGDKEVENAMQLVRARFVAYKLHLGEFIIKTTHPENPQFEKDLAAWAQRILNFSKRTEFKHLDIKKFDVEDESTAIVEFRAELMQDGEDVSFIERSLFKKESGHWLYRDSLNLSK